MRPLARRALAAAGLTAGLLGASCGGGGGGGPTGPPPPVSSIVFTPAAGGSGIQLASGAGSQGTTLQLEVRTTGIHDLYGVAFQLTYPAAALHFVGETEGSVLNAGGTAATSFQVVESPTGNLVAGLSRLGPIAGTSGAGALMTLQFVGVASGSGTLAFSHVLAADSSGNPIPGLTWAAGSVQVTVVAGAR
jgi:hypothetical protein